MWSPSRDTPASSGEPSPQLVRHIWSTAGSFRTKAGSRLLARAFRVGEELAHLDTRFCSVDV